MIPAAKWRKSWASFHSPVVVWVQWFFGKGCCSVHRAGVVVEGAEPPHPETIFESAQGQWRGALRATRRRKGADLVVSERRTDPLLDNTIKKIQTIAGMESDKYRPESRRPTKTWPHNSVKTHIWWASQPPDGTWRTPASRSPERGRGKSATLKTGRNQ